MCALCWLISTTSNCMNLLLFYWGLKFTDLNDIVIMPLKQMLVM
jgi:hypothetical protein